MSTGRTGDANEYRSPMSAGRTGDVWSGRSPSGRDVDEYRSPMTGPGRVGHEGRARAGAERDRPRSPQASAGRDRPMFPITCDACGKQAQVPFKPTEGREVLCPTCHRARKSA